QGRSKTFQKEGTEPHFAPARSRLRSCLAAPEQGSTPWTFSDGKPPGRRTKPQVVLCRAQDEYFRILARIELTLRIMTLVGCRVARDRKATRRLAIGAGGRSWVAYCMKKLLLR